MGRPAEWMRKLTGRGAMRSPGAPSHRRETERRFWEQIATGITSERAAEAVGVSPAVGTRWFRHNGGMPLSAMPLGHNGRSSRRELSPTAINPQVFFNASCWTAKEIVDMATTPPHQHRSCRCLRRPSYVQRRTAPDLASESGR